ncbi:PspC domain-containing protein [Aquabacterium sp. OR-4]|uniref:PspC domain-containing protein n=1 Tax=Aquabacterium sp. OR-4 TaxID=2978127 RepID=UPI0021B2A0AD|nr:PspC domain-containing protein [Aquabacterium sp. OR-4]MDT7835494.1 PspC domain-containing protein [Aquabacterium sp. OR-4]
MSIADDLAKLDDLRARGVLSDDEFQRAKQRLLDGGSVPPTPPGVAAVNALRRSLGDKWLGGVCGGLARVTGLDSWAWRLIFAVLFLWGGAGLLVYLLLWIFVPAD